MFVKRAMIGAAAALAAFSATPASAQFFLKSPMNRGDTVTGAEPGIVGIAMPEATPKELRAALVWNLRAALNVAALQCGFEPTLLTLSNYNFMLNDHAKELKESYDTLGAYFTRVNKKNKAAGQRALDAFGTRVYSGFSTVSAQYTFCLAADSIGRQVMFTKRGELGDVAAQRMRELRNSLAIAGEQQFPSTFWMHVNVRTPPFADPKCWSRKGEYNARRCGAYTGVMSRQG